MYGPRCNCPGCPVTDGRILELDHIEGKPGYEGRSATRSWLEARDEYLPDVYQLLCPNCHQAKTRGYQCIWHA